MAKRINTRIQLKHDTAEFWDAPTCNVVALLGEVIVYDADPNNSNEAYKSDTPRIKIGDGVSYVRDLPFMEAPLAPGEETVIFNCGDADSLIDNEGTNTSQYYTHVVKVGDSERIWVRGPEGGQETPVIVDYNIIRNNGVVEFDSIGTSVEYVDYTAVGVGEAVIRLEVSNSTSDGTPLDSIIEFHKIIVEDIDTSEYTGVFDIPVGRTVRIEPGYFTNYNYDIETPTYYEDSLSVSAPSNIVDVSFPVMDYIEITGITEGSTFVRVTCTGSIGESVDDSDTVETTHTYKINVVPEGSTQVFSKTVYVTPGDEIHVYVDLSDKSEVENDYNVDTGMSEIECLYDPDGFVADYSGDDWVWFMTYSDYPDTVKYKITYQPDIWRDSDGGGMERPEGNYSSIVYLTIVPLETGEGDITNDTYSLYTTRPLVATEFNGTYQLDEARIPSNGREVTLDFALDYNSEEETPVPPVYYAIRYYRGDSDEGDSVWLMSEDADDGQYNPAIWDWSYPGYGGCPVWIRDGQRINENLFIPMENSGHHVGGWYFNDTITVPDTSLNLKWSIYGADQTWDDESGEVLSTTYRYFNYSVLNVGEDESGEKGELALFMVDDKAYSPSQGWCYGDDTYRHILVTEEPSPEVAAWLEANATRKTLY